MSEAVKQIKVKPGINPATGETYYSWHPSKFRQRIPDEGTLVPHDIFTTRCLMDGTWVEVKDEPSAPTSEPAPDGEDIDPDTAIDPKLGGLRS